MASSSVAPGAGQPSHDSTVMKVLASTAPHGPLNGERYLASGKHLGLRLFQVSKGRHDDWHERAYECAGYCIKGKARLTFGDNKVVEIEAGTSYLIPEGTRHKWEILEDCECVEGTTPVCFVKGRDNPVSSSSSGTRGAAPATGSEPTMSP